MAKRKYKKKSKKKSKSSTYTKSTKLYKKKHPDSKIVRPELKYVDNNDSSVTSFVDTTPNFFILSATIPQGTGTNQRIGASIHMKSLLVRFALFGPTAKSTHGSEVPTQDCFARIIIFVDKAGNGTSLTQSLITTASGATNNITSPINLNASERFTILKDKVIRLGTGSGLNVHWKYYTKLDIRQEYFTGDTSGIYSGIKKNAIYMMLLTEKIGSGATERPCYSVYSRLRFAD